MYLLLADVSILGPHLPAVCGEVESHARAGTQQSFELGYANYALLSLPTLKSLCVPAIPRIIISLVGKLIRKILLSVYPPPPPPPLSSPMSTKGLTFRKKRSASLDNTAVPLGKQHFLNLITGGAASATGHQPSPRHPRLCAGNP